MQKTVLEVVKIITHTNGFKRTPFVWTLLETGTNTKKGTNATHESY